MFFLLPAQVATAARSKPLSSINHMYAHTEIKEPKERKPSLVCQICEVFFCSKMSLGNDGFKAKILSNDGLRLFSMGFVCVYYIYIYSIYF